MLASILFLFDFKCRFPSKTTKLATIFGCFDSSHTMQLKHLTTKNLVNQLLSQTPNKDEKLLVHESSQKNQNLKIHALCAAVLDDHEILVCNHSKESYKSSSTFMQQYFHVVQGGSSLNFLRKFVPAFQVCDSLTKSPR